MNKYYSKQIIVLFILSILILLLGFNYNIWKVADENWYQNFDKHSESLIVGRLIASQNEGIFSYGGLPGRIHPIPKGEDKGNYQFIAYTNNITDYSEFYTYNSQIGLQGIFFSFILEFINFPNDEKLNIFHFINSLLTAIIFSLIIIWIYLEFDIYISLIFLILIVLSPWITVFTKNIWWALWAFYVPFVACLYLFFYESKSKTISNKNVFIFIFCFFLIKCLFNGYEYITTTIIMLITPVIYYGIYYKWKVKKIVKRIILISTSAVSSIIVSFIPLCIQIGLIKNSFIDGINHIVLSFIKRSNGGIDSSIIPIEFQKSIQSNVIEVLKKYLYGKLSEISISIKELIINFNFRVIYIILFLALISLILYFCNNHYKKRKIISLIITMWISISAPISWFVIFKGHSYIHIHLNFITWYMPFMLFGFILIGVFVIEICKKLLNIYYPKNRANSLTKINT